MKQHDKRMIVGDVHGWRGAKSFEKSEFGNAATSPRRLEMQSVAQFVRRLPVDHQIFYHKQKKKLEILSSARRLRFRSVRLPQRLSLVLPLQVPVEVVLLLLLVKSSRFLSSVHSLLVPFGIRLRSFLLAKAAPLLRC